MRVVEVRFSLEVPAPAPGEYEDRAYRLLIGAGGEVEPQALIPGSPWLTCDPGERVTMRVLALAARALAQRDRVPTRTVVVDLGNLGPGPTSFTERTLLWGAALDHATDTRALPDLVTYNRGGDS